MPRVYHVKSARKAWPPNIEIGDEYWWWQFAFTRRRCSKTYPKRWQLTQSGFLSELWQLEDGIGERLTGKEKDDLEGTIEEILDEIQDMIDQCTESRENMPEHLQDVGSGELLQERIEALEGWMSEIQNVDLEQGEDVVWEDVVNEILETSCGL